MFDHVKFGVTDYATSKAFYIEALTPLGVSIVSEGAPSYGIEMSSGQNEASLCLYQTEDKPVPLHIAFPAATREQVDDFYRAASEAGGRTTVRPVFVSVMATAITRPS
jgi:catechol 2,3-dioxygenase-like lactoylglutathione lyase family enzyme